MKDMDGMETARKLRADKFRGFLIFITVLKEMVFQSFEVQAYDYLVKPVEGKQFEKTLGRLYASMQNAGEDSLLVQKGYEGCIIPKDDLYPFYATAKMQQMFLVFIPILMIFIMCEYINTIAFEYQYVALEEGGTSGYLFGHWQLFAMHLLGLLSLFCILFSYKKLQQNFRLSMELSLLEQEEHSLNRYVEEAKARYDVTA